MDDIVKQAMAKWPNVPHCYGWLALDARGHWRMRDERAQQLNLPGDKVAHAALLAFICRNYGPDERGCWYFQNGPQRVYLNLAATPYIARTDPQLGWRLQTGAALGPLDEVLLTEQGELVLRSGDVVAQLDDRDMAEVLTRLRQHGRPVDDEALLTWLARPADSLDRRADDGSDSVPDDSLSLSDRGRTLTVRPVARDALPARYGFVRQPAPTPVA